MSYDENLAICVQRALSGRADFDEKRMFGGLALARPRARDMDFTARPSKPLGELVVRPRARSVCR